jgi:hypothetical protein
MNRYLPRHIAVLGLYQSAIGMTDRTNGLGQGKLSTYGQDDLHLLIFVARETLVELESEYHFLH